MTAFAPAVDYEGSGALGYLRAETVDRREIREMAPNWSPYTLLSTELKLSKTITITVPLAVVPQPFDARHNLNTVRTSIRSPGLRMTPELVSEVENALLHL